MDAAVHGMQYGMITNLLWSWVVVMDGHNNMRVSKAFRYDASKPTVLQVCALAFLRPCRWYCFTCVRRPLSEAAVLSSFCMLAAEVPVYEHCVQCSS